MHDGSKATVPPVFTMFHRHQVEICKNMFGVNAQSSVLKKELCTSVCYICHSEYVSLKCRYTYVIKFTSIKRKSIFAYLLNTPLFLQRSRFCNTNTTHFTCSLTAVVDTVFRGEDQIFTAGNS